MKRVAHPNVVERRDRGRAAREQTPRGAHAGWEAAADRFDPIALFEEENLTREPDLVPVRHGRMMVSAFTFYRGAAKIMSADLDGTPTAGLDVQLCGDAHISNFGLFASPERTLLFDLNDFDETLPGPFEYDLKRMAASVVVAARDNGFSKKEAREATLDGVRAYREAMAEFAGMRVLDIWYTRVSEHDVTSALESAARFMKGKKNAANGLVARAQGIAAKARTRDSLSALSKLAERVDGRYRIVSQPPFVVPLRDVAASRGVSPEELEENVHEQFREYRETLQHDRRHVLEQFELVDVARKVVGVGSVGKGAYIGLLQGRDDKDPLFIQVKEATRSVLEDHLPKSRYSHSGERVVRGQRMMQAASDIFLGWAKGVDGHHNYWRQLRDMKGSAVIETMSPPGFAFYAWTCAQTLARAHARSGDPVAIAAYLGNKDRFDQAITDFAERYADQNERDYTAFVDAIKDGRLKALEDV